MKRKTTIGDLAKASGVKVVTIRYYEQAGLLPIPPRTAGNYRSYRPEHLQRLQFIRRLRDLGFPLEQVRELLGLASDRDQACDDVIRITREHLVGVEAKIRDLQKLAAELRRLSRCCRGGAAMADCRILEALAPARNS